MHLVFLTLVAVYATYLIGIGRYYRAIEHQRRAKAQYYFGSLPSSTTWSPSPQRGLGSEPVRIPVASLSAATTAPS
jgi:hypothetical protein